MPKKRRFVPERAPSKLQISKWERQKKMQRIILVCGAFIIVAVLGIIGFGYYDFSIKPSLAEKQELSQPALKVNDRVFSNDFLLKILIFFGLQQPETQVTNRLLDSTVTFLQNSEIIAQEARKLNINLSPAEIDKEMRKSFTGKEEDFARILRSKLEESGLAEEEYRTLVEWELNGQKVRDEFIKPGVPAEEMQTQVERILLRTEDEARKVAEQLQSGATFSTLVKAQSQDTASKDKDGNTGWITRDEVGKAFDEVAFKLKKTEISQPFFDDSAFVKGGYWIVKVTDKQDTGVKVQGILLRTEGEAREVKTRLEQGEDLAGLAREISLDLFAKETGGELGQITKGSYTPDFEQVVFNLEPGQLGGPVFDAVRTIKGGYWVVRAAEEPQMRPLEKSRLEARQQEAFQKWFEEKKKDYLVETYLDDDKKTSLVLKASTAIVLRQVKSKRK